MRASIRNAVRTIFVSWAVGLLGACGDSDGVGTQADQLGVGAECVSNEECVQSNVDGGLSSECLTQFKGGYCGIENCTASVDCPQGSACVLHDDGQTYCFRLCTGKPECNLHRSPENESNCTSEVDYVDGAKDVGKACVPPNSGI